MVAMPRAPSLVRPLLGAIGPAAVLALTACGAAGPLRHVDAGDAALAAGRLEQAERAYARALAGEPDLDEPEHDAWVVAKVERGRAAIELARLRQSAPWRNLKGTPDQLLTELHTLHDRVRGIGGDAAIEAALVEAMNGLASATLAALPTQDLPARARYVLASALRRFPQLTEATLTPIAGLHGEAIRVHQAALDGAGAAPLVARVHEALLAGLRGAPLPAAPGLAAPYARGVTVTVTGAACPGATAAVSGLGRAGAERTIAVTVEVATCADTTQTTRDQREVSWNEQELVRVELTPIQQQVCRDTYTEVRECFGDPLTCYSGTFVRTGVSCTTVEVGVAEKPIYRTVERSGVRPIERQAGRYEVAATWVARRGDREWRGELRRGADASGVRGDAFGVVPAFSEDWSSGAAFFADAGAALARDVGARLEEAFAADVSAAAASARQLEASGDVLAADQAWATAALLGGQPAGRWPSWGVDAASIVAAFDPVAPTAVAPLALAEARSVTVPARPRLTAGQLRAAEARLVPTLGATLWVDLHAGLHQVPVVMDPASPQQLAGVDSLLLGFRAGHRGLSSYRRATSGVGFVDDLAAEIAAGFVLDQPDTAIGTSTFAMGASYSAGLGFRRIGTLGLFGGARAGASWMRFGSNSGAAASVTPFARLELWLGRITVVADGMTSTVAGDHHDALALYLGRIRRDGPGEKLGRFLSVRLERRALDTTHDLTDQIDGEVTRADVETTMVTAAWGFGF